MDFGPLFITAGIAQAARDDVGFLSEILSWVRIPRSRAGRSGSSLKQQMTTARELPRPSFSLTSIETGVQL